MDFTREIYDAMVRLAENLDLNLELNVDGQVRMPVDSGEASLIAARITNDDFPYGYVVAENDYELIFTF